MIAAACFFANVVRAQSASSQPVVAESANHVAVKSPGPVAPNGTGPEAAQDATPPPSGGQPMLAEVTVTGLKHKASVEDLPASVNVIPATTISHENITNIIQLYQVVPGVRLLSAPDNSAAATIRGIGSLPGTFTFDQSVGLFFDGVYVPRSREYNSAVFDIDRVEVYKGSQSAILGKNTTAGAILMTPRLPGDRFDYDLSVLREFEVGQTTVNGGMDIPLGRDLFLRVAGLYDNPEGSVRNLETGRHVQDTRSRDGRATLLWTPGAARVNLMYQHSDDKISGQSYVLASDTTGAAARFAANLGITSLPVGHVFSTYSPDGSDHFRDDRAVLNADIPIGDRKLSVVGGYSTYGDHVDQVGVDLPEVGYYRFIDNTDRTAYAEARISANGRLFDYIAGLSYFYENLVYNVTTSLGVLGPYPTRGQYTEFDTQPTNSVSAFGQETWHVTDTLSLIAAARFTHQRRTTVLERDVPIPGTATAASPAFPATHLGVTDDSPDGAFTVQYQPTPGLDFYADVGKSSKGAGFVSFASLPSSAAFKGEKAYTTEAGAKVLGSWGHFDFALFNTRIQDFQEVALLAGHFVALSIPVRSRGAEADLQIPLASGLALGASSTYAQVLRTDTGTHLPDAPSLSVTANLTYDRPLWNNYDLSLTGSVYHRSESWLRAELPPTSVEKSPPIALLDARIALSTDDDRWEIALIGRNLTNKYYAEQGSAFAAFPPTTYMLQPGRPRTIALQLTARH